VNRTLRAAYEQAPRTFQAFTRRQTVNDFRTITRVSLSNMVGDLLYVPEGGEYKHATLSESAETYRVLKYGRIINVSWETLVNDDLDAFGRVPQAMANKAASLQSNIVYSLLTGAPVLSDGVALFNSAHANLAASGGAINLTTLGAARAAMSKQTDPSGDYLNITPRFLIVGPDREVEAQQILSATLVPSATTAVNPFVNSLQLIVDPRIGSAWYLAAAPAAIDTLEYAFLDGEELFTETERGFDVDGTRIKVRMVMGAAAIDHRGLYKNPGA
jgi:hypothetical protein